MEVALVTFLAPLLPYLLKKGEKIADQAVDAVGAAAWDRAKTIWAKLGPKVHGDPATSEAAHAVAEDPRDDAAKGALQFQLRGLLSRDATLNDELGQILQQATRDGIIAADGAVVIAGDISADHGGVVAGRDIHGGVRTGGS